MEAAIPIDQQNNNNFPPMMNPVDQMNPMDQMFGGPPTRPNLPSASPMVTEENVNNPVVFPSSSSRPDGTPVLQTPALAAHASMRYPGVGGQIDFGALGGSSQFGPINGDGVALNGQAGGKSAFSDVFGWSWECGSEVGSIPSVWSKATSMRSGSTSKFGASALSGDGQRLIYIKPQEVSQADGGTVIIGLRREIPEAWWNQVEILLVGGKEGQVTLKPSGIRKGKKLCIKVPPNLECRDYDVRVVFAGKILHGAIPLAVTGNDDDSD